MEESSKGYCHICFKQPDAVLMDFEPYRVLVQNITQIKSDISRILNKICESCASDVVAIDVFRSKFIETNEKWKKMLVCQSQPRPEFKNGCEECGKTCETTSIDLQTWKRVCATCSTDSGVPLELLNSEDIKQELPFNLEDMVTQTFEPILDDFGPKVEVTGLSPILENENPIEDDLNENEFGWAYEEAERNWIAEELLSGPTTTTEKPRVKKRRKQEINPKEEVENDEVYFEFLFNDENEGPPKNDAPFNDRLKGDDFDWPFEDEEKFFFKEKTPEINLFFKNGRAKKTRKALQPPRPKPEFLKKCDICKSSYDCPSEWELHSYAHDEKCKFCDYVRPKAKTLRDHVINHLPHLWPYLCDYCGAKFARKESFNFHWGHHDPEKYIYKCHFCSKGFVRKWYLHNHILKRHFRLKRFKCKYCPKAYIDASDRDRHQYIHTGKYPFWCSICNNGFPRKRELVKHMLKHE